MQASHGFIFDAFHLDLHDERLWRGQEGIHLHPKTFAVLCCLVAQAGQLVTKDALLAAVWPETVVSESVVTVAIRQLRRVLGDQARTPRFIETVHGRGYRFIAPLSAPASSQGPEAMGVPRLAQPALFRRPRHFVGRDAALAQLAQWWTAARQGTRQVGVIAGEAGIGKTALAATFVAQVAAMEDVWIGHGQCLDHYGAGEAYLPLLEALGRLCRGPAGEQLVAVLRQYAPSWLVQMPGLLASAEWETFQRTASGATQPRMLRELTEALDILTTVRPLVLVLEDLHWSDAATLAWLAYVARRPDPARLLLLGTYRPVDAIVRAHPIRTVMTELTQHRQGVELALDYLSAGEVTAYCAQRLPGQSLPPTLAHALYQRTRGHPLFLVTIVDEMQRQGLLHDETAGGNVVNAVGTIRSAVPESLRQIIAQQLHQVSQEDQSLLEAASIAGRAFSAAALAAAVSQTTEDLEVRLARLADHGQFIEAGGLVAWPDGTVAAGYRFRHDLYQAILYERIPPSRQQRWHLQIGARKELGYGARAREVAAELAVHFELGRDVGRAIRYLQYAADNALRRSAHTAAIAHLTNALALLAARPETPERLQHELALQAALGPALMAIKGYGAPEVAHAYARARTLCQQVGDTPQRFAVLLGLCTFYQERAELQTAHGLAEDLLQMAQRLPDPVGLRWAHNALGVTLHFMGQLVQARAHLEESLTFSTPDLSLADGFVFDPGVDSRCALTEILYLLGYPDQALQCSQEALALARELAQPFSLAAALGRAAHIHRLRGAQQDAQTLEEASLALYREQGFTQGAAQEMVWQGWDRVTQGDAEGGIAQMCQGLEALRATGAEIERPWLLSAVARAYGQAGRADEGLAVLEEALATVDKTGKYLDASGLYRRKGDLLLAQHGPWGKGAAEAEACFDQALAIARQQQAKALELRAAMSLARLWQQQGKRAEARDLLAPIYGWFTEGFDTAALRETKALLKELGG
jgi:DNA-binding winged helix-turn-helix (wHTH) protein/tetratricopeptide (TPR) repeat protein